MRLLIALYLNQFLSLKFCKTGLHIFKLTLIPWKNFGCQILLSHRQQLKSKFWNECFPNCILSSFSYIASNVHLPSSCLVSMSLKKDTKTKTLSVTSEYNKGGWGSWKFGLHMCERKTSNLSSCVQGVREILMFFYNGKNFTGHIHFRRQVTPHSGT